jgi:hypothetical protein
LYFGIIFDDHANNTQFDTMRGIFTYTILLLAVLSSCSGLKVVEDHDETVNFNRYGTYNFTPAADSIPINQMSKRRLFNAISAEMNENDIHWAANPDLYVHVHMIMKGQTKTNIAYGQGATYQLGKGFSTTYMDYSEFSEGSLFFDIIDAKRNQLVWTSRVSGSIKSADILSENDINKIVRKAFRNFPPR